MIIFVFGYSLRLKIIECRMIDFLFMRFSDRRFPEASMTENVRVWQVYDAHRCENWELVGVGHFVVLTVRSEVVEAAMIAIRNVGQRD